MVNELPARYFDGRSARAHAVRLRVAGEQLQIDGDDIELQLPLAAVKLSPRLGRTIRQIALPDGAVCELDDDSLLDAWFSATADRHWRLLAALERHWIAIAVAAVVIIALTAGTAIWGLPYAAQKIARVLPQSWAEHIGSGTLVALDEMLGDSTELSPERQHALRVQFAALAQAAGVTAQFEFRAWPKLGANALALPDGMIVVTDDLVKLADDDRELLAVVAHELGHVHERHALQKVIADTGLAALISALTGDLSGLGGIAVAGPTMLAHMHHSRALEADADRFGFALLDKQGIATAWFASIIRKLEITHSAHNGDKNNNDKKNPSDKKNNDDANTASNWLSSHPASEERAARAEHFDGAPR